MNVYVLETGCYDQRDVAGVYATLADAQAAWAPKPGAVRGNEYGPDAGKPWEYRWETSPPTPSQPGRWYFRAELDNVATITEYGVQGA